MAWLLSIMASGFAEPK